MSLYVCRMLSSKFSLCTWEPELLSIQTANTRPGMYLGQVNVKVGVEEILRTPQTQDNSEIKFNIDPSAFLLKFVQYYRGKH